MPSLKRLFQKWRTKTSVPKEDLKAATEPLPVVPPAPAPSPEVTAPPVKTLDKRIWGCVECKRTDETLFNVNWNGFKRKACAKHRSRYPVWVKGSMGFK